MDRDPRTLRSIPNRRGEKELEQLTCKSDVAEDTMSTVVKLAKDPFEPYDIGQPTSKCLLMVFVPPGENWLHTEVPGP